MAQHSSPDATELIIDGHTKTLLKCGRASTDPEIGAGLLKRRSVKKATELKKSGKPDRSREPTAVSKKGKAALVGGRAPISGRGPTCP
ncbi:MAG: hypothetical protein ACJ8FZ_16150, partial [Bradyrhizobium sp.]